MERRRYKRYHHRYEVLIHQDDLVLDGSTVDICQDGLGVTLQEKPFFTKEFPVTLFLPIGKQEMTADLCWIKLNDSKGYLVGLHLISTPVEYLNFTATIKYRAN
jgi:hypothetical protein